MVIWLKQRARRFDYIVASHVIEHAPNLLRFLADIQNILKARRGMYFDQFQINVSPLISIGLLLLLGMSLRNFY